VSYLGPQYHRAAAAAYEFDQALRHAVDALGVDAEQLDQMRQAALDLSTASVYAPAEAMNLLVDMATAYSQEPMPHDLPDLYRRHVRTRVRVAVLAAGSVCLYALWRRRKG